MREDVEFSYHELHVHMRRMYLSNLMCCFNGSRQSGEVVKVCQLKRSHERTQGRVGGLIWSVRANDILLDGISV